MRKTQTKQTAKVI